MNPRDKSFVVILFSTLGGLGLVSFIGYSWFWAPLKAYNATIESIQEDIGKLQEERNQFAKGLERLNLAKLKSLPIKTDQATAEYMPFLETTLRDAGLQVGQTTPGNAIKVKAPASVPEVKEVDHRIITFTVKASGEEAALVSALERLRKSHYVQRVKDLQVERSETTYGPTASKKLKIGMTIEVLLVAGNQNKMGLHPGVDPQLYIYNHIAARNGAAPAGWGLWASTLAVLASEQADRRGPTMSAAAPERRDYDDIARRNIFVGAIPIVKTEKPTKTFTPKPTVTVDVDPDPPAENVPAYVRLSTTVPSMQEAFLINRIFGGREKKLIAKKGSGYEVFKITDEDHAYVFFTGKVLAVESREIYFQVRDQIYKLKIDQTLAEAMRRPLSFEEILDLELNGLYDKEWAKEQMAAKKKTEPSRKGKGGKGR